MSQTREPQSYPFLSTLEITYQPPVVHYYSEEYLKRPPRIAPCILQHYHPVCIVGRATKRHAPTVRDPTRDDEQSPTSVPSVWRRYNEKCRHLHQTFFAINSTIDRRYNTSRNDTMSFCLTLSCDGQPWKRVGMNPPRLKGRRIDSVLVLYLRTYVYTS